MALIVAGGLPAFGDGLEPPVIPSMVRVGIIRSVPAASLSVDQAAELVDVSGQVLLSLPAGTQITLTPSLPSVAGGQGGTAQSTSGEAGAADANAADPNGTANPTASDPPPSEPPPAEPTPEPTPIPGMVANGTPLGPGPVRLRYVITDGFGATSYVEDPRLAADRTFLANGVRYRGLFELRLGLQGGVTVVNLVDLESYLRGVVPKEMPASFPAEALKAQAVAARTYAVYQIRSSRFAAEGFDVTGTTVSQVYGGASAEAPSTDQAVAETAGRILVYGGQPINALFHAASGGYTENNENVWLGGSPVPYLRGVEDPYEQSPHDRWSASVSMPELSARLAEANLGVGDAYFATPVEAGVSGRLIRLLVEGSGGSITLSGERFRSLLRLKSTRIEIAPRDPAVADIRREVRTGETLAVMGEDGILAEAEASAITVLGAGGVTAPLAPPAPVSDPGQTGTTPGAPPPPASDPASGGQSGATSGSSPEVPPAPPPGVVLGRGLVPAGLDISGSGWGHGVGMSQWGARGMAERGFDYASILTYYYQGTSVVDAVPAP